MLDKLEKRVCWAIEPTLAASLEPLSFIAVIVVDQVDVHQN